MAEIAETVLHEMSPPPVDMNGEEILIVERAHACVGKIFAIYDKAKRRFGMRVEWVENGKGSGAHNGTCAGTHLDLTREQIERIELNPAEDPPYLLNL